MKIQNFGMEWQLKIVDEQLKWRNKTECDRQTHMHIIDVVATQNKIEKLKLVHGERTTYITYVYVMVKCVSLIDVQTLFNAIQCLLYNPYGNS